MNKTDKLVEELQDEIKVLKNEVKETLSDIRDYLLTNVENPFPVELSRGAAVRPQPAEMPTARPWDGGGPADRDSAPISQDRGGIARGGAQEPAPLPNFGIPASAPGGGSTVVIHESISTGAGGGVQEEYPAPREESRPRPEAAAEAGARPSGGVATPKAVQEAEAAPVKMAGGREPADGQRPSEAPASAGGGTPITSATESETEDEEEMAATYDAQGTAHPEPRQKGVPHLVTVAMLTPWMEDGIRRIGQERLKVIVEVYASMGGLSPQLKEVLLQLISLDSGGDGEADRVSVGECMRVLAQLDNLMWRSRVDRNEAALLSVILNHNHGTLCGGLHSS